MDMESRERRRMGVPGGTPIRMDTFRPYQPHVPRNMRLVEERFLPNILEIGHTSVTVLYRELVTCTAHFPCRRLST